MCAFAKCHQACKSSRDCSSGERCVQSDRPYYVCQKQACTRNSECLGKQLCAQDGQCHDECLTQKDCLADQVCTAGACADTTELVNGTLPNVLSDAGGVGQRCTLPTDCPGDLVCLRGGVCGAECIGDKDCMKTYVCKPLHDGGPGRCFPEGTSVSDAGKESGPFSDAGGDSGVLDASDGGNVAPPLPTPSRLAGFQSPCLLFADGRIKCWGENANGDLGLGDTNPRGDTLAEMGDALPFVNLGTGRTAKAIYAGAQGFHCAILDNDKLKCWGRNDSGYLGLGDTNHRGDQPNEMGDNLPYVDLGTGRTVRAVAASSKTCAILDNGRLKCFGDGIGDQPNEMGDNLPYVDLGAGRTVRVVALGNSHFCAILDTFGVKCWGSNAAGQLGYGDTDSRSADNTLPYVDLGTGRTAKDLVAGDDYTCAILDNDKVKCWGLGGSLGALGLGDTIAHGSQANQMGDRLPYVDLGTGRTAKALAALHSGYTTCALLDNDQVKCWGNNFQGLCGQGDTNNRGDAQGEMGDALPFISLGTGRTAKAIDVSCALLDNDQVKCWGYNGAGRLGLGDTAPRGNLPNQMGDNLPYVKLVGP